jgi:hypothetical protein
MSNSADLINLIVDVIKPIGVPVYKFSSPFTAIDTERIVINLIANVNSTRWGNNRMNRFMVNVNAYVLKMENGMTNSARIATIESSIMSALESYNSETTRVKYYSIDPTPGTVVNESDKESLMNIRVNVTIT